MKITIDKTYTTIAAAPAVREAIQDFKAQFSDADVRAYISQAAVEMDEYGLSGDLLSLSGSAFPSGSLFGTDAVTVSLDFVIREYSRFWTGSIAFTRSAASDNCWELYHSPEGYGLQFLEEFDRVRPARELRR